MGGTLKDEVLITFETPDGTYEKDGTVPNCVQLHIPWASSRVNVQTMKKDSTPCPLLLAFVAQLGSKLLWADVDGRTEHGRSLVTLAPIAFSRALVEV